MLHLKQTPVKKIGETNKSTRVVTKILVGGIVLCVPTNRQKCYEFGFVQRAHPNYDLGKYRLNV